MAEAVSLETIAAQLERALSRVDVIEPQLAVLRALAERSTATATALAAEIHDFVEAVGRADPALDGSF